ncbi:MAG TPA: LLM class F420-dependent oxidoreductase [Deltaproteobacteria bacterium]|nr:LLM class F420-dependent oxidoreductase [Deltaproteobacteria bacterium]
MSAAHKDEKTVDSKSAKMAYGIHMPIAQQSPTFVQPWEASCGPEEMRQIAMRCDARGFLYLAVSDHVGVPRDLVPHMSATWYDPVATLAWLGSATCRVRLMAYVSVLPYRHPLQTAKSYATLDCLTGGRVILGVGAGHAQKEFEALGLDFSKRGKMLEEAIGCVEQAFREDYPEHDGEFWSYKDLGQQPRPVQVDGPPIWVGGSSRAAMRRAAELADGWLPQGPPAMGMANAIEFLHERRANSNRTKPLEIGGMALDAYVGEPSHAVADKVLTGRPERMAEFMHENARAGCTHMGIRLHVRDADEMLDQIDAFSEEVAVLL